MNYDPTEPDPLDDLFSAKWLAQQVFPPTEYVVPGIIPEGLTLLVAPPKIGKSWMVLGLGLACATGGVAFGSIPVDQRPVLYLALEDGKKRLLNRLATLDSLDNMPTAMDFSINAEGFITKIRTYLERKAAAKPLIILDTLGKVKGAYGGNDAYGNDYAQMSALKDLVDAVPGSSMIVVHHTNKGAKEDFLDSVSGTQGLAGAADSILLIQRDRQTEGSTLHVTSRDAKEGQYALTLADGVRWTLDGPSLKEASDAVQQRKATEGVGDDMADLVDQVNKYPEGSKANDLATMLGWSRSKVDTYLKRAYDAGRIEKAQRGTYTPVRSVRSVRFEDDLSNQSHTSNTSYTPLEGDAA